MKRVEIEADQMPGQDSFLDVITNIVGILILLVLVVGLRTSQSVHESSADSAAAIARANDELEKNVTVAASAERELGAMVERVGSIRQEVAMRTQERTWLQTAVLEAEQTIAARRASLSTNDQRNFDTRRKIAEAQAKLDELTREQIALLSREAPTEELACQPTPIAKAVVGKEVHIMLANDHVAIVPFEELMQAAKDDAIANIWRVREQDEMDRVVGPINGFRMKYWVIKDQVVRRTEAGAMIAGSIPVFSHCWLKPLVTPAGEPAVDAMQPNSELHQYLRTQRPDSTTVTIWTYPGNFERLRELKRGIREAGFAIAVRPLPPGMPIGASRDGTKSVTE
jgi:hypothetical protein